MNTLRTLAAGVLVLGMLGNVGAEEKKADTNKEKIVGTWEATKADEGALPVGTVIEYGKDGKMKITAKRGDKESTTEGTYTVDGDKLHVALKAGDKDYKLVITIKKMTATEYVSENEKGKTAEWKRKK